MILKMCAWKIYPYGNEADASCILIQSFNIAVKMLFKKLRNLLMIFCERFLEIGSYLNRSNISRNVNAVRATMKRKSRKEVYKRFEMTYPCFLSYGMSTAAQICSPH